MRGTVGTVLHNQRKQPSRTSHNHSRQVQVRFSTLRSHKLEASEHIKYIFFMDRDITSPTLSTCCFPGPESAAASLVLLLQ